MRWPDEDDQIRMAGDIQEFGMEGYGCCYLLGALRAQGMSGPEADHTLRTLHPEREAEA